MAVGADDRYGAEPLVCHACAARDRAADGWQRNGGDAHGVRWQITDRRRS